MHVDVGVEWLACFLPLETGAEAEDVGGRPALWWDEVVPTVSGDASAAGHVALAGEEKDGNFMGECGGGEEEEGEEGEHVGRWEVLGVFGFSSDQF